MVSHPPVHPGGVNREIIESAETDHGVTTFGRAAAIAGADRAKAELRSGRWCPMAKNVYRLRGAPQTWEQRVMALTLAAGPSAAASHRSAAALLGIPGFNRSGRPEATTPRGPRQR